MNVFENPWKFYRHPFKRLEHFFCSFKNAYQRAVKGYCNMDLWNLAVYYTEIISGSLRELAEHHYGYPIGMESEEWTDILKEIAYNMEESLEDNDNYPLPKLEAWQEHILAKPDMNSEAYDTWFEEHQRIGKEMDKEYSEHFEYMYMRKDKALDMLKEHWYDLWD